MMTESRSHPRVAVIGAGIAGLAAARVLRDSASVVVFEKSRGIGGRMSTRRAGDFRFDHGARIFDCQSQGFKSLLQDPDVAAHVGHWQARVKAPGVLADKGFSETRVSVPAMNSLCKVLADGLLVHTAIQVAPLAVRQGNAWQLHDTAGSPLGEFEWVISTAPAPQTAALFAAVPALAGVIGSVRMLPTHSLMLGLRDVWDRQWDIDLPKDGPFDWVSIDSAKPGRQPDSVSLLAQTRIDWSQANLETDPEQLLPALITGLLDRYGLSGDRIAYQSLHRWRYAAVDPACVVPMQVDRQSGLAAGGDWCAASRVEAAWSVGDQLGRQVLKTFQTGE